MSEIPAVSLLTNDVARLLTKQLGRPIKFQALHWLLRTGQIDAPPKDGTETYRWLPEHIDAARTVLAARKLKSK